MIVKAGIGLVNRLSFRAINHQLSITQRRSLLDLNRIVSDLKSERDRIGRAISALLEGAGLSGATKRATRKAATPKRRGGITPAGRKRLAAAMKARWATRRAKSATASRTSATKKRGGGMTAAARKRISDAMKKRWAEKKAASKD